jgi:hypothetical protein
MSKNNKEERDKNVNENYFSQATKKGCIFIFFCLTTTNQPTIDPFTLHQEKEKSLQAKAIKNS